MSLYTSSSASSLSPVNIPAGLHIQVSTDILLLSILGNTTTAEVTRRLANDNKAFIAFINKQPAAFGWMARDNARIGELNHEFILPAGNRYLWNFRTMEAYRGLGIYPALLQFILQNAGKEASRFWIIHAPENNASLKGIQKAGFEYVGKLYLDQHNKAALETGTLASSLQEALEYMDIALPGQTASSCWNCSSPYLKKRSAVCCCAGHGKACVGNKMLTEA